MNKINPIFERKVCVIGLQSQFRAFCREMEEFRRVMHLDCDIDCADVETARIAIESFLNYIYSQIDKK